MGFFFYTQVIRNTWATHWVNNFTGSELASHKDEQRVFSVLVADYYSQTSAQLS